MIWWLDIDMGFAKLVDMVVYRYTSRASQFLSVSLPLVGHLKREDQDQLGQTQTTQLSDLFGVCQPKAGRSTCTYTASYSQVNMSQLASLYVRRVCTFHWVNPSAKLILENLAVCLSVCLSVCIRHNLSAIQRFAIHMYEYLQKNRWSKKSLWKKGRGGREKKGYFL